MFSACIREFVSTAWGKTARDFGMSTVVLGVGKIFLSTPFGFDSHQFGDGDDDDGADLSSNRGRT